MLLVLRLRLYRNAPASLPAPAQFAITGGTIGRSPGNDLVLDDPSKYISRTHARVDFREGRFHLADLGSNPTVVNDRPLGKGREVVLVPGDQIVMGDYQLEVEVIAPSADATAMAGDDPLGLGLAARPAPLVAQPPTPPLAELPLFEPPPPRPPAVPPALAAFTAPAQDALSPGQLCAAEQHDSLAGASILGNPGPGNGLGNGADPLGLNLFGTPSGREAAGSGVMGDDPLGLGFRGSASDHAAPERYAMPAVPAHGPASASTPAWHGGGIPEDYDPMADFSLKAPTPMPANAVPASYAARPAPATSARHRESLAPEVPTSPGRVDVVAPPTALPEQQVAHSVPGKRAFPPNELLEPGPQDAQSMLSAAPAIPLPTVAASPTTPTTAAHDATLEALLRGLGLPDLQTKHSGPELAELVGAMLREATTGVMQTLMARSVTKRESRIERTMIGSQANNPLKFFPDSGSALQQMLSQTASGYMKPVRAFGNAFEDLQVHELAVMAGMRAALAAILARFDPAAIEKRLDVPTVMDKMLASSRKAKMWDRLVLLYANLSREAEDDFQRLFGESFAKAYEDQIDRLRGRNKQP